MKKILHEIKSDNTNSGKLSELSFIVSDDILTQGTLSTAGSKMLHNFVATTTATTVSLATQNGAKLCGKSNMSEFGLFGAKSAIEPLSDIKCPHDGAKAIVDDYASFAFASDCSGQARLSAAKCSLIGFKPTYGALSRYGIVSAVPSMESIAIIAKDIEIVSNVFFCVAQKDEKDATSVETKKQTQTEKTFKVGLLREGLEDKEHEPTLRDCAAVLHELGCDVSGQEFKNFNIVDQVTLVIASAEFSSSTSRYDGVRFGYRAEKYASLQDLFCKSRNGFGDSAKRMIVFGTLMQSQKFFENYYIRATKLRRRICEELETLFEKNEILLVPGKHKTYAKIASLAGLPAIVVPIKDSSVSLIAKKGDDEKLLVLAKQIIDYYNRRK